ncbi:MAG: alpha/beta fold hydrolase [Alphaproteobacteria bacterium]|nr:alpha/beta fold hydrolase [Alphaproteobacteria bacterium]
MTQGQRAERWISASDGARLFVAEWPAARARAGDEGRSAILCLPGLARHGADFADLAARLSARGRRVLCPDYRGRGRSPRAADWRDYSPMRTLADILDLLAALHAPRVVVVGTSFGGLLAMAMAAARPCAVAGLVLNDIGPAIEAEGQGFVMRYVGSDHPQPDWPTAIRHMQAMLPTLGLRSEAEWDAFVRNTFVPGPDGMLHTAWDPAIARAFANLPPRDLWRLFAGIGRIPALLVRGANSPILGAATAEAMAARKPDLERITVAGAGHCPTLSEPEVAPVVDAFLDAIA